VGDNKQSDIHDNGLQFCVDHFYSVKNFDIVKLDSGDIIRNPIIPHIINVFEKNGV
jgi:phosphate starvation-inducible protein PhoH